METKTLIESIACEITVKDNRIKECIENFPKELQTEIRLLCKQCFLRGFTVGVEETLRWKTNIDF